MRQANRPTYEMLLDETCDGITVLFQRYGNKLFRYGHYTWKVDEDTNWNLIYKTLYKVYEKRNKYEFDSERSFAAIVFKIYVNFLRKDYRKQQQMQEHIRFTNFNESLFEEVNENRQLATERQLQQKLVEQSEELEKAEETPDSPELSMLKEELAKLEDWQRMLLLLKSQNMPYKEIANFVDKPAGQLKVYYQRLKNKMMKIMNQRMAVVKNN